MTHLSRIFCLSVLVPGMSLLTLAVARADGSCDAAVNGPLHEIQQVADSIRVDKPGLARVYARDRAEFTAGQALWMKGQLRAASAECVRGEGAEAAQRLSAVRELLQVHAHQNL